MQSAISLGTTITILIAVALCAAPRKYVPVPTKRIIAWVMTAFAALLFALMIFVAPAPSILIPDGALIAVFAGALLQFTDVPKRRTQGQYLVLIGILGGMFGPMILSLVLH